MDKNRNTTAIVIGSVLLVLGVLSLLGNFFNFLDSDSYWPLIIIGVGAAFLVVVALGNKSQSGLAVPGSILVMIGLILFVMNLTNSWESWAYCWALVICASGIGVWASGVKSERPELRMQGLDTLRSGLMMFILFGVIMEFIFTLTGVHQWVNLIAWAILLGVVGLYLLFSRILDIGKPGGENVDLFWPILMVGAGVTAILWQYQVISGDNLRRLVSLWPLLLIVAGIGIIFRRSPWLGAALGLLVVAGVLAVGFAGAQIGLPAGPSWSSDFGFIGFGDLGGEQVLGSGNVVTEERTISGVSRVELSIPADLEIQLGTAETLTITGDDNILALLTTHMGGDKLTIGYKSGYNIRPSNRPQIKLTVKNLSEVRDSSSGSVKVGAISTGDFKINLSSSGSITIEALKADKVSADLSSSGDIMVKGEAQELDVRVSSSGNFEAGDFKVQKADIRLSSSGDVTLWVVEDLRANISSSGDIIYYGEPVVHPTTSSSGDLISKGNK